MVNFRTPRGYGRVDYPFQTRFENGTTPSYPLRPALFLPVWSVDAVQDDPITIPPGTFVGRLNARDHSTLYSGYTDGGYLAPACGVAYQLTYGALDLADGIESGAPGTPDIDDAAGAVVSSTGDSTATLVVKPCGIAARPYHAGWLPTAYVNYDPHLFQTWVSGLHVVRIPAMTSGEAAVEAGDLVKLDDTASPKWAASSGTLGTPGRIHAFDGGSYGNDTEYVVGRCVNKVLLGKQASISSGQSLRTAIGTAAPRTLTNLSTTSTYLWPSGENFQIQSKVEGVPGMVLSATSATLGRPAEMLYARADSSGYFWALDILLRV